MEEKIIEKIKNFKELDTEEIKYCIWELKPIEVIYGEPLRWVQEVTHIICIDNETYSIWYWRGLTECQENEYEPQIARKVKSKLILKQIWVDDNNG